MPIKNIRRLTLTVMICAMLAACSSKPAAVAPLVDNTQYTSLGKVEGSSCGSMLLGPTSLNFIPAGLNSRVQDAYADALSKKPGATKLVNVSISETWTWYLLGTARCVDISGEAVQ